MTKDEVEAFIKQVFAKHSMRLVGFANDVDTFDEPIFRAHPHHNDLFTCRTCEEMFLELETKFKVSYKPDTNSIYLKELT